MSQHDVASLTELADGQFFQVEAEITRSCCSAKAHHPRNGRGLPDMRGPRWQKAFGTATVLSAPGTSDVLPLYRCFAGTAGRGRPAALCGPL